MKTGHFVKQRDVTIDIVRSLAIVFMVAANMAVIAEGQPYAIFRLVSSMAAPIFITLACMMVVLGVNKNHGLPFVMLKCLFLIVVAILLDISNSLMPLKNIDVLYLIGILLIFSHLITRLSNSLIFLIGASILCITSYLQYRYGYHIDMSYAFPDKGHVPTIVNDLLRSIPRRYLIDGWFPIFPWASLACFSIIIAKIRYAGGQLQSFASKPYVFAACGLILLGGLLWYFFPGNHIIRYQYIELFYPPVPGFMLFTMGIALGLIAFVDLIGDMSVFAVIHPLGEASLFMYIFHLNMIHYILSPLGPITFGWRYAVYYLIFISIMIVIGLGLRLMRSRPGYKKAPYIIRWIFG